MTMRKNLAALLLIAPVAFSGQAAAQQTTDSAAHSQSVNQTQVIVGGAGGGGTNKVNYDGGYTVKSNPDVVPPMLPGGANPCVVGASAGGSVVGFGMAAGGSWNDANCERRNLSIVLLNAAKQFDDPTLAVAGLEVLCNNDEVAEALEAAGRPCLTRQGNDRPQQATRTGAQTASAGTSDFDWIARAGK